MTAITQKIRRFTGGISDQPDEQKIPGQLRDAVNCIPDVVQGLIKRPGMNLVNELDTDELGKWFFIDKSNNFNNFDRYVGRIDNKTGKVKVWDLDSGKEMDICYADNIDPLDLDPSAVGFSLAPSIYTAAYDCEGEEDVDPYEPYFKLESPEIDDLQVLTINDYTFVVNRKVPVQIQDNEEEKRDPEATVEIRSIAGLTEYKLEFFEPVDNESETTVLEASVTVDEYVQDAPTCSSDAEEEYADQTPDDPDAEGTGFGFIIKTTSVNAPTTVPCGPGTTQNPNGSCTADRCVYTTKVTVTKGGDKWKVGDTVTKKIGDTTYVVKVEKVGKTNSLRSIGVAEYTTERENPKADNVLDNLAEDIRAFEGQNFTVERIGNGLYITRGPDLSDPENPVARPFTMTTPNSILLRPLSATAVSEDANGVGDNFVVQANDVADVPLQTKHNLVFQIRNSFTDVDDYYLQFKGDNDADGTGTYVEVPKPGLPKTLEPSTMPHGLLRLSTTRRDEDNDVIVTFLVTGFKWASRPAGDDNTVPRPSFAPEAGSTFGRPINRLAFFRNRLVALTDENVVCSTAGDFFNFWAKTAISITASDPIDLQVSNNFPAVLYGAIATTAGLVMFSENAQFLLGTENDILEPRTARTTLLSTYNYNRDSNPVSLGTTVGFVSGIGRYTRFYEMASISRDQEPEVVEQTKVVERLVPGDYYELGITKDNQIVAMGKRGDPVVWVFRYFNTGEKRAQSAWSRWKFDGNIVSHACINDSYFAVLHKDGKIFLTRGDLRALQNTQVLTQVDEPFTQERGEEYRVYLDYTRPVFNDTSFDYPATLYGMMYDPQTDRTIFNVDRIKFPVFEDRIEQMKLITFYPDDDQGYIKPLYWEDNVLYARGDLTPFWCFLGYTYEMRVDLPQFFVKKESSGTVDSWDTANLIIQRVKFNFGRIGLFKTILKRLGRKDWEQLWEAKPMDRYDANDLGWVPDMDQTIPVYQRNTTFRFVLSSESPAPAVLYSATWEGQYQENYVKRL